MNTVTSADGTTIAYDDVGDGPPIICLHGSGVTREIWLGLASELASDARLLVPDRRGRGDSGDATEWSFQREIEDVEAIATKLDTDPYLFGSSYGGLLAMRVAEQLPVEELILYEPPLPLVTVDDPERESLAGQVERILEEGDRERAVKTFFQVATGADNVEHWPIWPECTELAETIIREGRVVESFDPAECSVTVPTLLLTGERSPGYLGDGIDHLHELIADSRVVEIEGAGHAGVATAPSAVGGAVRGFLDEQR